MTDMDTMEARLTMPLDGMGGAWEGLYRLENGSILRISEGCQDDVCEDEDSLGYVYTSMVIGDYGAEYPIYEYREGSTLQDFQDLLEEWDYPLMVEPITDEQTLKDIDICECCYIDYERATDRIRALNRQIDSEIEKSERLALKIQAMRDWHEESERMQRLSRDRYDELCEMLGVPHAQ